MSKKTTPIKRVEALKELSRDHYHGLLLCWKIRQGIKTKVSVERIKKYLDWFWLNHLKEHFRIEEELLFPILGNDNENCKKAISEHKRLKSLFENKSHLSKTFVSIEDELEKHIRFEERILFNEIQQKASEQELATVLKAHNTKFFDTWTDEFWKN